LRKTKKGELFRSTLIVVPAFNEEPRVGAVVLAIVAHGFDVVVIDDGSTDNTSGEARSAGARVVSHPFNLGQGASLRTGFDYAELGEWTYVVSFDADGQHDLSNAIAMLDKAATGNYDVVLGSRFLQGARSNAPMTRSLVLRVATRVINVIFRSRFTDVNNGLRVFRVDAIKKMSLSQNRMAHASEMLSEIKKRNLSWTDMPTDITYSSVSLDKGEKTISGSVKILWEVLMRP
jgi:glycosyltransferase involved in cell wall biosynthesis